MARFNDIKETFWRDGAHGVRLPVTDEMIKDAECVLDVTLPSSMLELLRVQNGGPVAPEWNAFPTSQPTSWSADHVPFDELLGIGRRERTLSLLDTPYLIEEWDLPSPVVLISGDGHWWIGLDYRICSRQAEPSVTWFDTELETELALASDFRSFVECLTTDTAFTTEVRDQASST